VATFVTVWPSGGACPVVCATRLTKAGVTTTPNRLDSVALKIAAGTLPRAMAVIATDDEIVEGKAQR
jgi:hypothetical protein